MSETVGRWTNAVSEPDMWVDPDDDPREDQPSGTDERSILIDYLRRYRLTMQMKCADLNAEQLARRSVPPSTMSLLGMVRHMADVERNWFRRVMAGEHAPPLYYSTESPDGDWDGALADDSLVTEAFEALGDEIAFAEDYVTRTDDLGTMGMHHGEAVPFAGRSGAHDRGVRPALRSRRPAARMHRRPGRPVAICPASPAVEEHELLGLALGFAPDGNLKG